jgi:FAD/FMN-containing dehydrogenase
VGIGGLALGGGHGILGRRYGLTLDHLVGAQVVLADGRVAECDEHHESALFWALRGAGAGNFGVVTSLAFRPVAAPASMANFHVTWSHRQAAAVIAAWQQWAPNGPDELSADLELTAAGDVAIAPTVEVHGAVLGTRHDADGLLDELTALAGTDPRSRVCTELSYRETIGFQAAPGAGSGQDAPAAAGDSAPRRHRFTKSGFFDEPLPSQAVGALAAHLAAERVPGQDRSVIFAPWGGSYNRQSPHATAFPHRSQLFLLEYLVLSPAGASAAANRAAHQWATKSWASVYPWATPRVYPNFPIQS